MTLEWVHLSGFPSVSWCRGETTCSAQLVIGEQRCKKIFNIRQICKIEEITEDLESKNREVGSSWMFNSSWRRNAPDVQMFKVWKLAPSGWYRTNKFILSKIQILQILHGAKTTGQITRQVIIMQIPAWLQRHVSYINRMWNTMKSLSFLNSSKEQIISLKLIKA